MGASTIQLSGKAYTYADLERLPEDERSHYELSYGVLVVTPAPNTRHQQVLGKVVTFLERIKLPSQVVLPEANLYLGPDLIKRPDVQLVDENLVGGPYVSGTPALVVEILSPATSLIDRTEKRSVYETAGIAAYWLIDPDQGDLVVLELDQPGGRYIRLSAIKGGVIRISIPKKLDLDPESFLGVLAPTQR